MNAAARIPSLKLLTLAFHDTRQTIVHVVKKAWPMIIFLHLLSFAADQMFSYGADVMRSQGREEILVLSLAALLQLIFTLFWSAAWILVIAFYSAPTVVPLELMATRFNSYLNQLLIEQIRALASVLFRVPLLIIPALVQYVRLIFVPFVIIFDADYARGEADALKRSRQLSRGHLILLSFLAILTLALPSIASTFTQGSNSQWVWENPVGTISGSVLTLFINTALSIFLVAVYRRVSMITSRA